MKYIIIFLSITLLGCTENKEYNNALELDEKCYFDPGILSRICKKDNSFYLKWDK